MCHCCTFNKKKIFTRLQSWWCRNIVDCSTQKLPVDRASKLKVETSRGPLNVFTCLWCLMGEGTGPLPVGAGGWCRTPAEASRLVMVWAQRNKHIKVNTQETPPISTTSLELNSELWVLEKCVRSSITKVVTKVQDSSITLNPKAASFGVNPESQLAGLWARKGESTLLMKVTYKYDHSQSTTIFIVMEKFQES